MRADPAQLVPRMGYKGTGYQPLSAGDDVSVAHLSPRVRPVAHLCAVYIRSPNSAPRASGCPTLRRVRPVARPSWAELARRPARSAGCVRMQRLSAVLPMHGGLPAETFFGQPYGITDACHPASPSDGHRIVMFMTAL